MKIWILGEGTEPERGVVKLLTDFPGLQVEVLDHDPMEPIRKFIVEYENAFGQGYIDTGYFFNKLQEIKKADVH